MSRSLADILGWEEGAIYKLEDELYTTEGGNLYFTLVNYEEELKWTTAYLDIDMDLVRLVNEAKKVIPRKYYLEHKFLGRGQLSYLNRIEHSSFSLDSLDDDYGYQTKFTSKEIKEIERAGFDLSNFRKIEVVEE